MKAKRKVKVVPRRRRRPVHLVDQSKALAVKAPEPKPWELSHDELTLFRNAVAKGASDEELRYCLVVAKRYRLDPVRQQIWFVPRWDSKAERSDGKLGTTVYVPVVSMNGLLHIAARDHADFGSYSEVEYGPLHDVSWKDRNGKAHTFKAPEWARIEAHKKGCAEPTIGKVWWEEIYPDVDNAPMVRRMPRLMLGKCAKANATRTAYPETGGLLIHEETHSREFTDVTPGGRLITQEAAPSGDWQTQKQAISDRIVSEKKKAIAERSGGATEQPKTVSDRAGSQPQSTGTGSQTPLMRTEYVDPKKSECPECKASFGVHLTTCSKFVSPQRRMEERQAARGGPGGASTPPPAPKTEAAYDQRAAASIKDKTIKAYRTKIGDIAVMVFHASDGLAFLLDKELKDVAVWAPNLKARFIAADPSMVETVRKTCEWYGFKLEEVAGPGPMAPPAAKLPPPPPGVTAAPELPPTGGTATIQSVKEITKDGKTRLLVMFGGQPHTCWDKKLWDYIKKSVGQSAEFKIEVKGQWRTIQGITRIGRREYDQLGPVRTPNDFGTLSLF